MSLVLWTVLGVLAVLGGYLLDRENPPNDPPDPNQEPET